MTALYLLAAHMLGDYVFQTRWQAAGKFTDAWLRTKHVAGYTLAFVPVAFYAAPTWRNAVAFLAGLYLLHFLTDSRRAAATLGDWIGWYFLSPSRRADEVTEGTIRDLSIGDYHSGPMLMKLRPSDEKAAKMKVPANPWTPIPILVDQTLHICQLALLGGLLLR